MGPMFSFYWNFLRYRASILLEREFLAPRYAKSVPDVSAGQECIASLLRTGKPIMVCRWGASELRSVYETVRVRRFVKRSHSNRCAKRLCMQAGFFPSDKRSLEKFADRMLADAALADCIGIWNNAMFPPMEDYFTNTYSPHAQPVPLKSISPCESSPPWSRVLKHRKVLVVHPFAETIKKQYARRELLFDDPGILPEFDLRVIKAVQSAAGEKAPFATWFDALAHMEEQIAAEDFDVALIGAGAYGLPLAAHVKRLGKQAVHVGGALQLLFGIMGKRWEDNAEPGWRVEHWVRPSPEETPGQNAAVEEGCYW